jgi:hypothetical protein
MPVEEPRIVAGETRSTICVLRRRRPATTERASFRLSPQARRVDALLLFMSYFIERKAWGRLMLLSAGPAFY